MLWHGALSLASVITENRDFFVIFEKINYSDATPCSILANRVLNFRHDLLKMVFVQFQQTAPKFNTRLAKMLHVVASKYPIFPKILKCLGDVVEILDIAERIR